jgi:hypothetical protein
MELNLLVPIIIAAALVVFVVVSAVRIVPQARRYNVERFGRYRTTLEPGLNFIIPLADRINTKLDVREQVFSSQPKPVITEDNLVVNIDTVLPHLAQGGNTFWVIPGELTQAVRTITDAFSDYTRMGAPAPDKGSDDSPPSEIHDKDASRQLTSGGPPSLDAAAAAERVAELAEAAVNDAKAEAAANDSEAMAAQSSSRQDAERGPTEIATHRTGAACSSDSPTSALVAYTRRPVVTACLAPGRQPAGRRRLRPISRWSQVLGRR